MKGTLGFGVDLLYLPRIHRLIEDQKAGRLARRILSNHELSVWTAIPLADQARRARYLAVRWCVKEAAYKAVFPIARPTWKDLTFHSLSANGTRKPMLEYHSNVPPVLGAIHTTVTHDGDYVFAAVLVDNP